MLIIKKINNQLAWELIGLGIKSFAAFSSGCSGVERNGCGLIRDDWVVHTPAII